MTFDNKEMNVREDSSEYLSDICSNGQEDISPLMVNRWSRTWESTSGCHSCETVGEGRERFRNVLIGLHRSAWSPTHTVCPTPCALCHISHAAKIIIHGSACVSVECFVSNHAAEYHDWFISVHAVIQGVDAAILQVPGISKKGILILIKSFGPQF